MAPRSAGIASKNQIENLCLELIEIANGVDDAAYFQQSVKISGHAGGRGHLLEHNVGLQIPRVLRPKLGGVVGYLVLELKLFGRGRVLDLLAQQE